MTATAITAILLGVAILVVVVLIAERADSRIPAQPEPKAKPAPAAADKEPPTKRG